MAEVANYGPETLKAVKCRWKLVGAEGATHAEGSFTATNITQGRNTQLGNIQVNLQKVKKPEELLFTRQVNELMNSYQIWIYPAKQEVQEEDFTIPCQLNDSVRQMLKQGGTVFLLTDSSSLAASLPGAFQTDFWSYPMFKKYSPPGTMGILCDPSHPALAGFPTESHSNWQWWRLVKNNPAMILNSFPQGFIPNVQVIDNFERNHRLGLLFEARVGQGKLVVSSIDLLKNDPVVQCLLKSITYYIKSKSFNPYTKLGYQMIVKLFKIRKS